jgi:hypothetical protein
VAIVKRGTGVLIAAVLVALAAVAALSGSAGAAGGANVAITYVTGTNSAKPQVWVADAHGQHARRLGLGSFPLISPNGKYVAGNSFGASTTGVIIYNTSGGVFGKFGKDGAPDAWSSDSRYLATSVFDPVSKGVGNSQLAVVDTQTKKVTVVAHGLIAGASFSPTSADTLVFGLYKSQTTVAPPVNLYTADPTGAGAPAQLTHDNNSLNPLWGKRGIVYDRQTKRKLAPEYQLYLLSNGKSTQLTNIKVDELSEGLAPVALSSDGTKLAAEYVGQDNSEGWAVNVATHKAREIATSRNGLEDDGISRSGKTLLVNLGIFGGDPSNKGKVETIPFGGGPTHVLVANGNEPTWNQ